MYHRADGWALSSRALLPAVCRPCVVQIGRVECAVIVDVCEGSVDVIQVVAEGGICKPVGIVDGRIEERRYVRVRHFAADCGWVGRNGEGVT